MNRRPAIDTPATRLLGCDYPILLACPPGTDRARSAAAASNAGAFGCVVADMADAEKQSRLLRRVRSATSEPFGVCWAAGEISAEGVAACLDHGAKAIVFGRGVSPGNIAIARSTELVIVCQVASVPEAVRAASLGADVLIVGADGVVTGAPANVSQRLLLRQIRSVTDSPLLARSSIADGAELVAALAAGAAGLACEPATADAAGAALAGDPETPGGLAVSAMVARIVRDARTASRVVADTFSPAVLPSAPMPPETLDGLDPVHYSMLRDGELVVALNRLLKLQLEGARACAVAYPAFADPAQRRLVRALACEEARWAHRLSEHIEQLTETSSQPARRSSLQDRSNLPERPAPCLAETVERTIEILQMVVPLTRNTAVGGDLERMLGSQCGFRENCRLLVAGTPHVTATGHPEVDPALPK